MWLSLSAGTLVILTGLLLFGCITSASPGHEYELMLSHYNTTETAYRMEHGFENAVVSSIVKGLSEPEQVAASCKSALGWASRENISLSIFFGPKHFDFNADPLKLLSEEGRRLLARTLKKCSWACVIVFRQDSSGCIVVRNDGLVPGAEMFESGIVLEKGGVRVLVPEGRRFCKRG